jgi:hypothetical protein
LAGILTVDTIQSDSSYASTLNVASKINFTSGMQIGGQDTTFGGMRNRIINGNMVVDQRYGGSANTPASDGQYTLDRWTSRLSQTGKYSVQQVADGPDGFINSLKVTSLSAYSVTSSDYFQVGQYIEGLNAQDLMWGTATAKTVTLSFWTKSSLTGTFGGSIFGYATGVPSYPFSYTINAANTWEYKTITIPGPTTGTWSTNNNGSIVVLFSIGVGSTLLGTANTWNNSTLYRAPTGATSVVGTNGATFQITGVQFEKGSTASAFEQLHYSHILALCQRYYYDTISTSGSGIATNALVAASNFPVTMRTSPTVQLWYGGVQNRIYKITDAAIVTCSSATILNTATGVTAFYDFTVSTIGVGTGYLMQFKCAAEL